MNKKKIKWISLILSIMLLGFMLASCDLGTKNVVKVYYDVNEDVSGAPPVDEREYTLGDSITVKDNVGNLMRTEYEFDGWSYNINEDSPKYCNGGDIILAGVSDIHFIPIWIDNPKYIVTFVSNSETSIDPIEVITGHTFISPPEPTKVDYTFTGWYSDSELLSSWDFANNLVTDSITLYAKWINYNLEFNKLPDGTYKVSGVSPNTVTTLTIPSEYLGKPVTSIGGGFYDLTLVTLVIPNSVVTIGPIAFCADYGEHSMLKNLSLGSNVKNIGVRAFANSVIETLEIPPSVEIIADQAFSDTPSLVNLTLSGSNLKEIANEAFYNSKIETLVIPASVVTIKSLAFRSQYETLKTLTFMGSSLKEIEFEAFYGCSIESLVLPNSVESIGRLAFNGLKVPSFIIPLSVKIIDENAFTSQIDTIITCEAPSQPLGWDTNWCGNSNAIINFTEI